jgi:hypothetical protein
MVRRGFDPGTIMARDSIMAFTWTETRRMLDPIPPDRQLQYQGQGRHRPRACHRQADRRDARRPVESTLGKGSAFQMELARRAEFRKRASMSKRILVVEDQEDLRGVLRDLLTGSGYTPA